MAIPDFVASLREKIGTDPLWLSGVTAVVLKDEQILLVQRADNGAWTPVTGIVDPGEQPADAAIREVVEEAGVHAVPERLVQIDVTDMVVYEKGDRSQYIDLVFRMGWVGGDPYPADGENTKAAWFPLDARPPMSEEMTGRIEAALSDRPSAHFRWAGGAREG